MSSHPLKMSVFGLWPMATKTPSHSKTLSAPVSRFFRRTPVTPVSCAPRISSRGVAAADDDDGLAAEEEPVARRAGRDSQTAEAVRRGGFARNAEPLGRRARGDD
jgi:hypothetical protein